MFRKFSRLRKLLLLNFYFCVIEPLQLVGGFQCPERPPCRPSDRCEWSSCSRDTPVSRVGSASDEIRVVSGLGRLLHEMSTKVLRCSGGGKVREFSVSRYFA